MDNPPPGHGGAVQGHDAADHPRPASADDLGDVAVGEDAAGGDSLDDIEHCLHEVGVRHELQHAGDSRQPRAPEPSGSVPAMPSEKGASKGQAAGWVGIFDRAAATYDQLDVDYFDVFGKRLVEIAAVGRGERVLDLGCGRGATLFPAAAAVGPTGTVHGIDLAPGMVARTSNDVRAGGLPHVQVSLGDAAAHVGEPGSVDVILASFVLFFLDDLDCTLRRYAKLLRPGGRLAFSWFGELDTRWTPVFEATKPHLATGQPQPDHRSGTSPWRDIPALEAVVRRAGYADVTTIEEEHLSEFRDDDHWYAWTWSHGARGMWESIPVDHRKPARAAAFAAMDGLRRDDGSLPLISRVRYTAARPNRSQ